MHQLLSSFPIPEFHILLVLITTQEPHQWTQMPQSGKELTSITAKILVITKTNKEKLILFNNMVKIKKLQLILDFLIHQPYNYQTIKDQWSLWKNHTERYHLISNLLKLKITAKMKKIMNT